MIEFKILKKSKNSRARLGILKTPQGFVETPSLVPVATQAVVKTLTSESALETRSQLLICNTFHLHIKPGEDIVRQAGGLNKFMNWPRPLMTDSGGFQVFSLGFGHDLSVGKILGYFPGKNKKEIIDKAAQPKRVRITYDGVHFRSPFDGKKLFIGPKESIKIQEALGADVMFAFDECTPPLSTHDYVEGAVRRTHRWAKICLEIKKSKQALYGIIQGSKFKDLRLASAEFINSLGFDGFGIGGDLGEDRAAMIKILGWIMPNLEEKKPRHLLGIGYLEDMKAIVKSGVDTFDCTVPTHYARHGVAFTSRSTLRVSGRSGSEEPSGSMNPMGFEKLNLRQLKFLKDKRALDKKCACRVCQSHNRSYIAHLVRAGESTGLSLLTFHNLHFFNTFVEKIRQDIKNGNI